MPTDSKFTAKIIAFMKREDRPVTASEIQEAVGMSRQGAYYWLKNEGKTLVRAVGEGRNTATAYVLNDDVGKYPLNFRPHMVWTTKGARGRGQGEQPSFRLGMIFTVVGLRMEDGETLLDMVADDGVEVTVNVGA